MGTSKEELKEKEEKASKIKRVQEEKLMRIGKEMVFFIYLALPLGIGYGIGLFFWFTVIEFLVSPPQCCSS